MDPIKASTPQETKLHFLDYWRIIRIRKTVILAVFLLVVITATLVTLVLPEAYSSTAKIQVERDQTDIPGMNESRMASGYDPYFIQTEFELIQSEVLLDKVIQEMHLNEVWGKKYGANGPLKSRESLMLLRKNLDLRPVRSTSLIEIRVYSDNKDEAASLANAIAKTYQAYRLEERSRLTSGGIEALESRFKQQSEDVDAAAKQLDKLREDLKIPDNVVNENGPTVLMTADTLRRLVGIKIESKANLLVQETLLDQLRTIKTNSGPEKLAEAIPSAAPDPLLSSLMEQLSMAEQSLVLKEKDYGSNNVEVVKVKDQVKDLQEKIKKRVDGVLDGLDAKVKSLREGLAGLESQVANAETNDIETAKRSRPYFEKKSELEELKRFRTILSMKMETEKMEKVLPKTTMVKITENAYASDRPVRPNKTLNIALGIIIGLVVGVGLAFFIEYLDTSVKTIDDVERSLQSPVLGVIPQNVGLLLEEGAESPHAEAYRVLRTNLLFSRKDDKLNTVAVVSAGAGEGKSTTVFNLAAVFAQSGARTLVVDSDLRRPTLHKMMKVTNNLGLTNYLLRQNTLEEVIQTSKLPTLDFLASGKLPSSSLGILSSAQMRDLITELKRRYDFVFFDSPPIMGVSDASILASEVDMTLQVIQYRRYPQPMNIRAKQMIEKVGGNLVGIVLNNINMSQDENYYYYSGYYHEYYSRSDDQEPVKGDIGGGPEKNKPEDPLAQGKN
jgi:capsular exopolysaccharide synthesis family protein